MPRAATALLGTDLGCQGKELQDQKDGGGNAGFAVHGRDRAPPR